MSNNTSVSRDFDVVVVGAGPYGLSVAAHLKAKGLGVRVFGEPMDFWANKMPSGMLLRSPREASNLSDPRSAFSLGAFEAENNIRPESPLPLKTFVAYGRWFRDQLGPIIDLRSVTKVSREMTGFKIELSDGNMMTTHRVIVAAGVGNFQKRPEPFAGLVSPMISHCYEGRRIDEFIGKTIAVIGAGQSSLESAALLHEAGANVEVIARIPRLRWIGQHSWLHHLGPLSTLMYSKYDIGPAGISRLVSFPQVMYRVPAKIGGRIRTRAVRPAGSRWLPARLANVRMSLGRAVGAASESKGDAVRLRLDDGTERMVDHVLLGTGYRVDIARYPFLPPPLLKSIHLNEGFPQLDKGFSSSVSGLHFIGASAARSFGPLLCFVAGAEFASRRLTSRL